MLALLAASFLALPLTLQAPDTAHCDSMPITPPAVVPGSRMPFAMNEDLQYSAAFGKLHVGSGEMRIVGRDTVRGHSVLKAVFTISGGFLFLHVHDTTMSWFDTSTFHSLRFVQALHEPHYHAYRDFQIFPDREQLRDREGRERPSVPDPLDDVSFVYYVRTLPLQPGQCYEFRRYFERSGNPVVVHVLRRDTVTVPAGTFRAIVIRPEVTTSGIFAKGRAELWLSDDSQRLLLQLKSSLPFGSINLYLKSIGVSAP